MKKQYSYIYYKKKGNKFGFQAVGFNLIQRMEMCIDLISSGVVSVKADNVVMDKFSDDETKEKP